MRLEENRGQVTEGFLTRSAFQSKHSGRSTRKAKSVGNKKISATRVLVML